MISFFFEKDYLWIGPLRQFLSKRFQVKIRIRYNKKEPLQDEIFLVERRMNGIEEQFMFYTHYVACCFILWVLMGMPITIISGQYSRSRRELHLGIPSHRTCGILFHMALWPFSKQFIFMAKRNSSPIVFLAGGFRCVGLSSDRPWKSRSRSH